MPIRRFILLLAVGAILTIPPPAKAQDPCNSLYAAYSRDLGSLATCNTASPGPFGELCLAGETPNACLDRIYAVPPVPTNAGGGTMEYKYLPRCKDGTDNCQTPEVRCHDGTRPMVYVDLAVDPQGNDMYSNGWIFHIGGEGQPCDAGANHYPTTCWEKYSLQNVNSQHRKALSSRHPDFPNDPQLSFQGSGITSPVYNIGGEINNFAHYNRIKFKRCAMGSSEDTVESAPTSPAETATTYHWGVNIWKSLFRFLDTPAGRSLTNGDDLPPLSNATTVILAAGSDAVLWLIQEADLLRQELEALSANVNVRIVLDGYFDPMLENEARYNDPNFTDIFSSTFGNPNGYLLPPGFFPLAGRYYDESGYDTCGAIRLNWDNRGVRLDESCLSFHGVGVDKKYCYDSLHVLLNHVTTPFFIVADQMDPVVKWAPLFPLDQKWRWSSPAYYWTDSEFRTRVLDQAKDVRDYHATNSEEFANQPFWRRGLYFTNPSPTHQHTHLADQSRFFGDGKPRMLNCNGAIQLDSVAISEAVFRWVTFDTGIAAIEDPNVAVGFHWVTDTTTCGNPL